MFVAAKAGVGRSGAWMAGCTGDNRVLAVSQRECMLERGGFPGYGGVAGFAVCSSLAGMGILA